MRSNHRLLFGTCTGTLLTGLALLRAVDPKLSSPAPQNMVTAAGLGAVFGAPLLLVVMPYAVTSWSVDPAWALTKVSLMLVVYLLGLFGVSKLLTRPSALLRSGA